MVGDALRRLHADPAAPWTVSSLADRTGVSRSTLAKRFADVARTVGYPDPFGFSAAFKRVRGANPSEFRRTAT